eukprot:TRINITY_DN51181_c0_g1_i1.p1 TRINITY_DN51181_c0_g1~~TRINITY_DN51181_c0_g1_i1.p1  ORF type:complete len:1217 (+),score=198.04 TRINITY_DN51181_c0_g1_i1:163-3813(+)
MVAESIEASGKHAEAECVHAAAVRADGVRQAASALTQGTAAAAAIVSTDEDLQQSSRAMHILSPPPLHVSTARLPMCEGKYEAMPELFQGSHQVWQQKDGDYYLFFGPCGRWFIGDDEERQQGFNCNAGVIASVEVPLEVLPHEVGCSRWLRFDGDTNAWQEDDSIAVRLLEDWLQGDVMRISSARHRVKSANHRGSAASYQRGRTPAKKPPRSAAARAASKQSAHSGAPVGPSIAAPFPDSASTSEKKLNRSDKSPEAVQKVVAAGVAAALIRVRKKVADRKTKELKESEIKETDKKLRDQKNNDLLEKIHKAREHREKDKETKDKESVGKGAATASAKTGGVGRSRSPSPAWGRGDAPSRSRKAATMSRVGSTSPSRKGTDTGQTPTSQIAASLEEWKATRSLPSTAKVFSVQGCNRWLAYNTICDVMEKRGWIKNEDNTSLLWELKFLHARCSFGSFSQVLGSQALNYFDRTGALTTKNGLCKTMLNYWSDDGVPVDDYVPRCFDLSDKDQADTFNTEFKVTKCMCLLRRFVNTGGLTRETAALRTSTKRCRAYPKAVVSAALAVCRRRVVDVDRDLDIARAPAISFHEWSQVESWSLKNPGRMITRRGKEKKKRGAAARENTVSPSHRFGHTTSSPGGSLDVPPDDASESEDSWHSEEEVQDDIPDAGQATNVERNPDRFLLTEAQDALAALEKQSPQYGLDGVLNNWIIKPSGKSRGRGIQLSAHLERIQEFARLANPRSGFVVQKYMENPLIINKKKFDIRQWVLVTRFEPLTAWFWTRPYVRFSLQDYDPSKLKNRFAHLTNNCISHLHRDYEAVKEETMWQADQMQAHLKALGAERNGKAVEDPWTELIIPQMQAGVLRSLCAAAEAGVSQREASFELFGYDFMISEDLNVWLIEVNATPDLSPSTAITTDLVRDCLTDMVEIVVDVEGFGTAGKPRAWKGIHKVGGFELLQPERRDAEEGATKCLARDLAVVGTSLKPRKPRRGECLMGTDGDVLPQYNALELLAAAELRGTEDNAGPTMQLPDHALPPPAASKTAPQGSPRGPRPPLDSRRQPSGEVARSPQPEASEQERQTANSTAQQAETVKSADAAAEHNRGLQQDGGTAAGNTMAGNKKDSDKQPLLRKSASQASLQSNTSSCDSNAIEVDPNSVGTDSTRSSSSDAGAGGSKITPSRSRRLALRAAQLTNSMKAVLLKAGRRRTRGSLTSR